MKLLFDQNLSFKLSAKRFADPGVESRLAFGLSEVGDRVLRDFAKANGFTIVSQDVDFAERAALWPHLK
jgi:predicted nuclease of predicted toxin-antitoxin system